MSTTVLRAPRGTLEPRASRVRTRVVVGGGSVLASAAHPGFRRRLNVDSGVPLAHQHRVLVCVERCPLLCRIRSLARAALLLYPGFGHDLQKWMRVTCRQASSDSRRAAGWVSDAQGPVRPCE